MIKSVLILLLLTLSLYAKEAKKIERMVFKTIKNEFIIVNNDQGNLTFVNKKYRNKNVVLYLFGRDCSYCKKKIPIIKKLMKHKDVQIIGIHSRKVIGDKALKAYVKKVGYTFDILSFENDIKMLNFLKNIGVWLGGVPFAALVDKDGNVFETDITKIDEDLD